MLKVSILMLTYNHGDYIKTALDSILCQKVDFEYQIVIGDDCSKDNTKEIISEYCQKYPDKIKFINRDKNIGVTNNIIDVIANCKGEYIAILEGDDYWIGPNKLQKSIDFLEQNQEYIGTAHSVKVVDIDNKIIEKSRPFVKYKGDYNSPNDLFKYNSIPTLSLVFRNVWGEQFSILCKNMLRNVKIVSDYPIKTLLLTKGKIKYFNEEMGAYRWVHSGNSSFTAQGSKGVIKGLEDVLESLKNLENMDINYKMQIKKQIIVQENMIILAYLKYACLKKLNKFIKEMVINDGGLKTFSCVIRLPYTVLQYCFRKLLY